MHDMGCLVRLGIKKPTNVGFLERWYPVCKENINCKLYEYANYIWHGYKSYKKKRK